jgi:predicted TIM-barrel fold metal-dependent hydrolase
LVDTHFHFWDLSHPELQWEWLKAPTHEIVGDLAGLRVERYGVEEYLAETRFHNVVKGVYVQAAFGLVDPVLETAWAQSLADSTGWPHGFLGYCDLADPGAGPELDRHLQYGCFRGLRDIGPTDRFEDRAWRQGYAQLAEHDLTFCHSVGADNMHRARALAAAFPRVTFCVDQSGMPLERSHAYFEHWRRGLTLAASEPNVVCKISSLGMGDHRWTKESLRPWVLGCIDAFGPQRCFFGSNWPVDRLYSSYGDLVDAYASIIAEFDEQDQVALMSANAERVFRL